MPPDTFSGLFAELGKGLMEWGAFAFNAPTIGVMVGIFALFRAINASPIGLKRHWVLWSQPYRIALGPLLFIAGSLPMYLPSSIVVTTWRGEVVLRTMLGLFAAMGPAGVRQFLKQNVLKDDARLSMHPSDVALLEQTTGDLPAVTDPEQGPDRGAHD